MLVQLGSDSIDPDATDAPEVRAGECRKDGDHRDGGGHRTATMGSRLARKSPVLSLRDDRLCSSTCVAERVV